MKYHLSFVLCVESESLNDERGRDPAKSLERESNPPSQSKFRMIKISVLDISS